MIHCQGSYGWKGCLITCTECDFASPGLYKREMDTGKSYYADATQDMLDEPCPVCGAKLEER